MHRHFRAARQYCEHVRVFEALEFGEPQRWKPDRRRVVQLRKIQDVRIGVRYFVFHHAPTASRRHAARSHVAGSVARSRAVRCHAGGAEVHGARALIRQIRKRSQTPGWHHFLVRFRVEQLRDSLAFPAP